MGFRVSTEFIADYVGSYNRMNKRKKKGMKFIGVNKYILIDTPFNSQKIVAHGLVMEFIRVA